VEDREHHDLVPLLANFVDDDIEAFDELVRPGIKADAAMRANPGVSSSSSLRKIRSIRRVAARGLSFAMQLEMP
jgi:hypothetical protein